MTEMRKVRIDKAKWLSENYISSKIKKNEVVFTIRELKDFVNELVIHVLGEIKNPENNKEFTSSKKKKYSGVGTFDLDRTTEMSRYSKIYSLWQRMLRNCYVKGFAKEKGWTVCDQWLLYSNFKEWCLTQGWDKRTLCRGKISENATVYSPENCHFLENSTGRKEYDTKRKLYSGVGFDDLLYEKDNHRDIKAVWSAMLSRCYKGWASAYEDCTVCKEWHTFSNFKNWMIQNDYKGKVLDKDLLVAGNRVYSPETCLMVEQKVNQFLIQSDTVRYPKGYYNPKNGFYEVRLNNIISGKRNQHLGRFKTQEEATGAWLKAKHELALQLADTQTDEKVANALRVRFITK